MFARIGTFSGAPERVDDEVTRQAQMETFPILQSIPGFAGVHVFADRQIGKTIARPKPRRGCGSRCEAQSWTSNCGQQATANKRVPHRSCCSVQRVTLGSGQVRPANRAYW
jgi:hypothetical protein